MKVLIAVCIAASVALCGVAGANENYKEKVFNADSKERFEAVATDVRKEMEPGGRYQYVKPKERTQVDGALAEFLATSKRRTVSGDTFAAAANFLTLKPMAALAIRHCTGSTIQNLLCSVADAVPQ